MATRTRKERIGYAETIWNKAIKHFDENEISMLRGMLQIPGDGFEEVADYERWQKLPLDDDIEYYLKNFKKKKLRVPPFFIFQHAVRKIEGMSHFIEEGFESAISDYILFGAVREEKFEKCNYTNCKTVIISEKNKGDVEPGLYIRIGQKAIISYLDDYLQIERDSLKKSLEIWTEGKKEHKRIKGEDFKRNNLIYLTNKAPKKELKQIYFWLKGEESIANDKHIIATNILNELYDFGLDSDNFKSIVQKEKRERRRKKSKK